MFRWLRRRRVDPEADQIRNLTAHWMTILGILEGLGDRFGYCAGLNFIQKRVKPYLIKLGVEIGLLESNQSTQMARLEVKELIKRLIESSSGYLLQQGSLHMEMIKMHAFAMSAICEKCTVNGGPPDSKCPAVCVLEGALGGFNEEPSMTESVFDQVSESERSKTGLIM